jgi:hypothetical protein
MTYVFLGPSLPLNEARGILDACYLPPAKQGDIVTLVEQHKPHTIALIDGYFFQTASVWHKEILYALEKGILVVGSSSMGALRAAETGRYGMVGIGEVFKLYHDGLPDDDEVALIHAPPEAGYLNLSYSMVNIRFTLKQAHVNGLITDQLFQEALDKAKKLHFTERTLDNMCRGMPDHLRHVFQNHYVDQKKEDAKLLLQMLARSQIEAPPLKEPIAYSSYRQIIYHQERSISIDETKISLRALANHTALHHPNFSQLRERALNRLLVGLLAKILHIEINEEEIAETKRKFLKKIPSLEKWQKENHLSEEDFQLLMEERTKAEKLYLSPFCRQQWKFQKAVLDELRFSGEYPHWAKEAASIEEWTPYYSNTTHEEIHDREWMRVHLRETDWDLDADVESWCEANGFTGLHELAYEVHRAHLAREALKNHLLKTLFD